MGRYSPTVLPEAPPSPFMAIANAILLYQQLKAVKDSRSERKEDRKLRLEDRATAADERARGHELEDVQLGRQHIYRTDPASGRPINEPSTPLDALSRVVTPEWDRAPEGGSATPWNSLAEHVDPEAALAGGGAPETAGQPGGGHPGSFDPMLGTFPPVRRLVKLSPHYGYDEQGAIDQQARLSAAKQRESLAGKRAELEMELEVKPPEWRPHTQAEAIDFEDRKGRNIESRQVRTHQMNRLFDTQNPLHDENIDTRKSTMQDLTAVGSIESGEREKLGQAMAGAKAANAKGEQVYSPEDSTAFVADTARANQGVRDAQGRLGRASSMRDSISSLLFGASPAGGRPQAAAPAAQAPQQDPQMAVDFASAAKKYKALVDAKVPEEEARAAYNASVKRIQKKYGK